MAEMVKIKLKKGQIYKGSVYPQGSELSVDKATAERWINKDAAVSLADTAKNGAEKPATGK